MKKKKVKITEGKLLDTQPVKMFYGWHIDFVYKEYTFRWQHWNRIDMYETDKRLEDYQEYKDKCIIYGEQIQDSNDLVTKLERCIKNYNDIKNK